MTDLPTGKSLAEWRTQPLINLASQRLTEILRERYPEAAGIAHSDPVHAIQLMGDVTLQWLAGSLVGACELGGVYDSDVEPPVIKVVMSRSQERNNFTVLHELGHHLLAHDEQWSYSVRRNVTQDVEERVVSAFASRVLLPDEIVVQHLQPVTALGIASLIDSTSASATACCVRALTVPGERLVILTMRGEDVIFAGSNGRPFAPRRDVPQPLLEAVAVQAESSPDLTAEMSGSEGILYASGSRDTDVNVQAVWYEQLVIAVVTSTPPPRHVYHRQDAWLQACDECGAEFPPAESPCQCARCGVWKCPECNYCLCAPAPVICDGCWTQLSRSLVEQGLTRHPDC